jgi:uncharacterized membrane protein
MESYPLLIALRIAHVVGGVLWVGGVMVMAAFIVPASRAVGPAAAPFMNQLVRVRKLPIYLLGIGWLTVIAGFVLYGRTGMLAGPTWFGTVQGQVLGAGGIIGLVVVLMGTFFNVPTMKRMMVVGAQMQAADGSPSADQQAEMQRLQLRMKRLTEAAAVLLMLATVSMAVARYL